VIRSCSSSFLLPYFGASSEQAHRQTHIPAGSRIMPPIIPAPAPLHFTHIDSTQDKEDSQSSDWLRDTTYIYI